MVPVPSLALSPRRGQLLAAGRRIAASRRGLPFLFKLRGTKFVAGVGFFEYSARMTIADAWEFYGIRNGAEDLTTLVRLIQEIVREPIDELHTIGCTILSAPIFFDESQWLGQPPSWKAPIQSGTYMDLDSAEGKSLWSQVAASADGLLPPLAASALPAFGGKSFVPVLYLPRQGQGTFRRLVLDAYGNRCAVSGERTLPVLEAAHITPFSKIERHEISNGVALRSDIHKLYDRGFVSIRPDNRFVVSKALAEQYHNGRIYYELHEREIRLPENPAYRPNPDYLHAHFEERFKR